MGLLSDPEYGSAKWVNLLKLMHRPVCFICYAVALLWFVLLGHRQINNETYFSENALLPGLVTNEFNGEQSAKQLLHEFTQELEDKYADRDDMPVPWLVGKMAQLHLEVYTHNFTVKLPMGDGQVFTGNNVYGILRAARTPSLEAIVLSVPYRSLNSHEKGTTAGIALMLAFAEFARPQKYWAKDIIFLITEHEQIGMQAWLEAYHGIQTEPESFYSSLGSFWKHQSFNPETFFRASHEKCLNAGTLKGRSGSIQAAINLEFHTPKIKYIEVKVEGLNGQLPNLDLVNLVHKLCTKFRLHHSFKNSFSWYRTRDKMQSWRNGVENMVEMVMQQMAGVPNGNHGLFHRYGIEAVTLEGRDGTEGSVTPPKVGTLTPANFHRLGVALESIMRSLNNLLERFHQSYFFYLLAATDRFISIGQYMPCLCLFCVALLVRALSLWVTIGSDDITKKKDKTLSEPEEKNTEEESNDKEEKKMDECSEEVTSEDLPGVQKSKDINLVSIGTNIVLVHLHGYAVRKSPHLWAYLGATFTNYSSERSVHIGFIVILLYLLLATPFFLRLISPRHQTWDEVSLLNVFVLIELATVCLCVGMHNFSLGLVLGAAYTPLALMVAVVRRGGGRIDKWCLRLKRVVVVLLNPFIISCLVMMCQCLLLFPEEGAAALRRALDGHAVALMFSVVDDSFYGNWTINVVTLAVLPIWIQLWQIVCYTVEPQTNKDVTEVTHQKID